MARKKYKTPDEQLSMFEFDTPSMPVLDVSRCEARLINHETAARMVETYHYAHRVPSITFAIGLYLDNTLAGVLTYSTMFANISSAVCGEEYKENLLELSRLFIHDWAGRNCESWLIGQSFRLLQIHRPDIKILVSYADSGKNHIGFVYQATNWLYTGMSDGAQEFIIDNETVSTRNGAFRRNTRKAGEGSDGGIIPILELEKRYGEIEKIKTSPKHRYVYFLGSKKQRKELRKALKWPVLPYPKRETT